MNAALQRFIHARPFLCSVHRHCARYERIGSQLDRYLPFFYQIYQMSKLVFSLRLPFIIITPPRFLCDSRSNFFFLFILSFYYFKCKSCFQFFFQSGENVSSENFHSKLDCFQSFSKLKLINKKIYMYIYKRVIRNKEVVR